MRFNRIPSWSFPSYKARLPDHYYKHRMELKKPSTRVHDRKLETDLLDLKYNEELKKPLRVRDVPIPVTYPKEADLGIWGGEGIVVGYVKPRKYFQAGWPRPKIWFPNLKKVVIFSEILDKHFNIICTEQTLKLIDDYYGFDNYILKSPVQDLKSQLALMLRRKMLLTLIKEEFRNENHKKEMLFKYSDCIIPLEEAEWFGLSVPNALLKHKLLSAKENIKKPLKYELAQRLIQELKNEETSSKLSEEQTSSKWFDKIKNTLGINKS